MTSILLACYGGMYIFSSVQEVVTRAFYAMKDTKTPLKIASVAILANSAVSIILTHFLGIGGIALGTTISAALAMLLLVRALHQRLPMLDLKENLPTLAKMAIAGISIVIVGYVTRPYLLVWNPFVRFGVATVEIFGFYFVLLSLLKCKEVTYIANIIKRKIKQYL